MKEKIWIRDLKISDYLWNQSEFWLKEANTLAKSGETTPGNYEVAERAYSKSDKLRIISIKYEYRVIRANKSKR